MIGDETVKWSKIVENECQAKEFRFCLAETLRYAYDLEGLHTIV